ncbi:MULTISPECIES: hypothetical protein [Acidithrix]|uniref:Uncharacterized protein n=1 Tax=Acidithrix ferrooxidans TaxID=1280514 RepID=A0A0D8HGX9_9ACTN|nr:MULTISPECIES: hypothetical protein [Acidithrix]KJF17104.1 hypothetical protein AXFE_20170 [Acidithrix ferrooxidans]
MRSLLNKKEKLLGFAIAIYAIVVYLILWIPHLHDKVVKGQSSPYIYAIEGVAIALFFALTVFVGKRIWVGFAGLALSLGPLGKYVVLMMPAVIFAAFSGFRFVMQPKKDRIKANAEAKQSAKATSTQNQIQFESRRITPPKPRKKRQPTPAPSSQLYGSLGRLGPKGGASSEHDNKK